MAKQTKTAYVIDDEDTHREKHKKILEEADFEVITFESVDEVMTHMGIDPKDNARGQSPKKNIPDVIVTDAYTNTSCDGIDLIKALKGTAIGRVLVSNIEPDPIVINALGKPARFVHKVGLQANALLEAVKDSMESAVVEAIGIKQKEKGRENL